MITKNMTIQEMKMLDKDKKLTKEIKALSKKFFANCTSTYKSPKYDEEIELSLEIKELKKHLYKIQKNKNLKILSIKDGPIPIRIIKKLTILSQLEEIELCDFTNEELLKDAFILFKRFKNLKKLTIHNSDIKYVPKEIGELKSLISLRIYFTNINSLPTELGNLIELENLDVVNDNLNTLPKSIIHLKKLQEITMSSHLTNDIKELKQNLPNLNAIYFQWNNHENILL